MPPLVPTDLFQSVTHNVPVDKNVIEYGSLIDLNLYFSIIESLSMETKQPFTLSAIKHFLSLSP